MRGLVVLALLGAGCSGHLDAGGDPTGAAIQDAVRAHRAQGGAPVALVEALREVEGVARADVGAGEASVWWARDDGSVGVAIFRARGPLPRGTAEMGALAAPLRTPGGTEALILAPFDTSFEDRAYTDGVRDELAAAGFSVALKRDGEADAAAFTAMGGHAYVHVVTHGAAAPVSWLGFDVSFDVVIATATRLTDGERPPAGFVEINLDDNRYVGVHERSLEGASFPNSLVVIDACQALQWGDLADRFIELGAAVVIGWDHVVPAPLSREVLGPFVAGVAAGGMVGPGLVAARAGLPAPQMDERGAWQVDLLVEVAPGVDLDDFALVSESGAPAWPPLLFVRDCAIWRLADGIVEPFSNPGPGSCLTAAKPHPERGYLVTVLGGDGAPTHGTAELVQATDDETLARWTVGTGSEADDISVHAAVVGVDPGGRAAVHVVENTANGRAFDNLRLVDLGGETVAELGWGLGATWSPDGTRAAYALRSCAACAELHIVDGALPASQLALRGADQATTHLGTWFAELAFAPDGERLAVVSGDGEGLLGGGVQVLDASGLPQSTVPLEADWVDGLVWTSAGIVVSADGRLLAQTGGEWQVLAEAAASAALAD